MSEHMLRPRHDSSEEFGLVDPIDQNWLSQYVIHRDQAAFTALVQRHEGLVRGACRRILRDLHLAEDAFQATFLVLAVRSPELLKQAGSLAGWLHTVATNAALQLKRTRTRTQRRELVPRPMENHSPLQALVGLLDEELHQLETSSREAIILCHLQGRTQEEAAAELGVSKATLRRRIEKGLATLRRKFSLRGLIVPALAVLWNALSAEECPASEPADLHKLAEAADGILRGRPRLPFLTVSQSSWNLTQGILAMNRWNRIRRWSLAACLLVGLGSWEFLSNGTFSEAGDSVVAGAGTVRKSIEKTHNPPPEIAVPRADQSPAKSIASGMNAIKQKNVIPQAAMAPPAPANALAVKGEKPKEKAPANDLLGKLKAVKNKAQEKKDFPPLPPQNFAGKQAFQGVMNFNGQVFQTNNPEEFQKLMKQNQPPLGLIPPGAGAKSFQGVININGVEQRFDDPDEFTEAAIGADLPLLPGFQIP